MTLTEREIGLLINALDDFIDDRISWWSDDDLTEYKELSDYLKQYRTAMNYLDKEGNNVEEMMAQAYERHKQFMFEQLLEKDNNE